jgi:hypothetical protein
MIRQIRFNKNWLELLDPKQFQTSIQILDSNNKMDELGDYEEEPLIVTRKKKTAKTYQFHEIILFN